MKFTKQFLVSALISALSLPALATSDAEQTNQMPMGNMVQNSAPATNDTTGKMPNGMSMNMPGNNYPGYGGNSGMPMDMGQMNMGRMNMGNMNMRRGNFQGMPMYSGQQYGMPMMPYHQHQMPMSSNGTGHHWSSTNNQGGSMSMPMMKMMQQKSADMKQHREKMELHLANIEDLLQELLEAQKAK